MLMDREMTRVLDRVAAIAENQVASEAVAVDKERHWPERGLRALQTEGLGGLVVPEADGGSGHGLGVLARVCELLGTQCPSTAICFGMHCVGTAVIVARATSYHRARYLDAIVRGDHLTALALSEPGSGAHFYMPQTRMTECNDGVLEIDGSKAFVTNGGRADSYVVSTVAADPGAPLGHFSCVVVPAETPGLVWGPQWNGLGMRGNCSRALSLENVRVTDRELLGAQGDQMWYVFNVITPYFLIAMAGTYLGVATRAVSEAQAHLKRRRYDHSGATLAESPVLQYKLGALWSVVERTRGLVYHAAQKADAGESDALPSLCAAKAEVADCAVHAVNEAMTLCGGAAYSGAGTLSRFMRDALASHVMSPTTDLLRTWTGRALLDLPILGD